MMGNESTEESRKEMRNRPGAPSPPANAIILSFQPLRLRDNRNSRLPPFSTRATASYSRQANTFAAIRTISLADSSSVLEQRQGQHAHLLRKRGAVEVVHEDLHQCGAVEIWKPWYFANHPDVSKPLDGFAVLPVLVANQNHAMHRQFSRV
jgi:hypothetical protein